MSMNRLSPFVVTLFFSICAYSSLVAQASFQDWQSQYFSSAQLSDPNISGINANPAGDGKNNLLKYALGLDPTVADGGAYITAGFDDNGLPTVSFP